MEEYVRYLNSADIAYTQDKRGFIVPLDHVLADVEWHEGINISMEIHWTIDALIYIK
jgi:hypothetical protein